MVLTSENVDQLISTVHLEYHRLFPGGGGGGALRYREGPHLSYVFRGRRGLF